MNARSNDEARKLISFALSMLIDISDSFLQMGDHEQAMDQVILVLEHPTYDEAARARAQSLLTRQQTAVKSLLKRRKGDDLKAFARALIDELSIKPPSPEINPPTDIGLVNPFTKRELEILCLMAEGLSNRRIGERLFLSTGTVKWYVSEIYSKLGVSGRVRAVARARGLQLVD